MDLATAVSEKSHLSDALAIIFSAKASGILRVISSSVNGRLAIDSGEILGAINTYTGTTGDGALHEFMESGVAVFQFIETDVPSDLRQSLSVDTGSYVYELEQRRPDEPTSEDYEEHESKLIGEGPGKSSLNEEQQKLLGLYARLNNEADRRAFLQSNTEFSDMMDGKGLNELQRRELQRATYGGDQASMQAFIDFQEELLGDAKDTLSPQQRLMLQEVYSQLTDQESREAFLKQNFALTDDKPVNRAANVGALREEKSKQPPKYDDFIPELSNLSPGSSQEAPPRPIKRRSLEEMEALEREEMTRSGAHYFSLPPEKEQPAPAQEEVEEERPGLKIPLPFIIIGGVVVLLVIALLILSPR